MDERASDTVSMIGSTVRFLPMAAGARYELSEWDVDPGVAGPPIHVHREHDEGFYVMVGRFGFVLDGVTTFAGPGAHVLVPKGHSHSFWNAGSELGRLLLIVSPPGMEAYFRATAAALVGVSTQDDAVAVRIRLSETYDLQVVGPPAPPLTEGS
ncbi:MAG TPA: cupin domain-containing protein [Candidatus Sulfotelmatobacter sp.]|nr:cupin domain-containing protein [Candidatus Sulfotelmatobacter sp.]